MTVDPFSQAKLRPVELEPNSKVELLASLQAPAMVLVPVVKVIALVPSPSITSELAPVVDQFPLRLAVLRFLMAKY